MKSLNQMLSLGLMGIIPFFYTQKTFSNQQTSLEQRIESISSPPDIAWQKTFGGNLQDSVSFIQQTNDDGYILVGKTASLGDPLFDVYVLKLDKNGEKQWQKTFGRNEQVDYGFFVQETFDKGFIIGGYTSSGQNHALLIRLNKDGDLEWQKTYEGDGVNSVRQIQDGGFLFAGTRANQQEQAWYVIKTDSVGTKEWETSLGSESNFFNISALPTSHGGYLVIGSIGQSTDQDIYVAKLRFDGSIEGENRFGWTNLQQVQFAQQTGENEYTLVGSTLTARRGWDTFLLNIDSAGDINWMRTFGIPEFPRSVQRTTNGGYAVAGTTYILGHADFYLSKTDQTGSIVEWDVQIGQTLFEDCTSFQQTKDGGFILAGNYSNLQGGDVGNNLDILIIKLGSNQRSSVEPSNWLIYQ